MKAVSKKLLSILLVAILLISAIPFQALAAAPDGHYTVTVYPVEGNTPIYMIYVPAGKTIDETLAADASLAHYSGYLTEANAAVPAGYDFVGFPSDFGTKVINGDLTVRPAVEGKDYILTLNAGEGKFAGEEISHQKTVTYGQAVGTVEKPTKAGGYTFSHWEDEQGNKVVDFGAWNIAGNGTYTAKYTENLSGLTIKALYYANGNLVKTEYISTTQLNENTRVLEFLNSGNHKTGNTTVGYTSDLFSTPVGYSWDGIWYNYDGNNLPAEQTLNMMAEKAVCVKFNAKQYTITFSAPGATVSFASKKVTYGQPVGALATATSDKKVFDAWYDDDHDDKVYTSTTVYNIADNITLSARWMNEAQVFLYLHTDKVTNPLIVKMPGYVAGEEIDRAAVQSFVTKYYGGSSMTLKGVYSTAAWKDYVAGKDPTATPSFTVGREGVEIHVLISNGTLGAGTNGTTAGTNGTQATKPTTKPADKTNPQTGDNSMIYVTSSVMLLAAAALVVAMQLRKKKVI